ncbi:MAG: hypothetical protein HYT69_00955 [Candidatus Zambryskibacteria bacterium]|nr:hypothetical protein [Candidatus Zambryskibacteria bacterium]
MKKLAKILPLALLLTPTVVAAQFSTTRSIIEELGDLVRYATIVIAGIALLVFFWGLVKFIFKVGGDEKAVADGRRLMIWGLIALFVMVSIWGLIYFIQYELFGGQFIFDTPPDIPVFP